MSTVGILTGPMTQQHDAQPHDIRPLQEMTDAGVVTTRGRADRPVATPDRACLVARWTADVRPTARWSVEEPTERTRDHGSQLGEPTVF